MAAAFSAPNTKLFCKRPKPLFVTSINFCMTTTLFLINFMFCDVLKEIVLFFFPFFADLANLASYIISYIFVSFCSISTLIPYFFKDYSQLFKNIKNFNFPWFRTQNSAVNSQSKTQNKPKQILLIFGLFKPRNYIFFNRFRKFYKFLKF